MAQWDVYRAQPGAGKRTRFVVDVQHGHLEGLSTRYVMPIFEVDKSEMSDLTPFVEIEGKEYAVRTDMMVLMQRSQLKKVVCSISEAQDDIKRALDLIFVGF